MRRFLTLLLLTIPLALNAQYKRVISLAPSLTEIIYFIGGEEFLVANTRYCDYPAAAKDLPKIGGIQDINIEKILLLKPDLVLASWSGNSRQTAETLEKMGIKVILFKEQKVSDILTNVQIMGKLLDKNITEKTKFLQKKLALVKKPAKSPRSLLLLSINPLFSVSRNSFPGNALELAGYKNVLTVKTPYPQISQENLGRHHPEVLILMDSLRGQEKQLKKILKRQKLDPQILYIDTDPLSRPGPRIFDAILELNQSIRP